ncbi:MAG TPA: histidine kinase [Chryseolinea sp.]|nr:histidine kinase [Chryseolinea sp.]
MTTYDFIFSDRPKHRVLRHLAFWLLVCMYLFVVKFYLTDIKYLVDQRTYAIRLFNVLLSLPLCIMSVYVSIYVLLPAAVKGRYLLLFALPSVLLVLIVLVFYEVSNTLDIKFSWDLSFNRAKWTKRIDFTLTNGLFIPVAVSTFAVMIKVGKNWYFKERENERLIREKVLKELRLLKTQLHPQFLCQVLEAIEEDLPLQKIDSSERLLKVADLLSYILYESEDDEVALERELEVIEDYVLLERVNFDFEVQWMASVSGDPSGRSVAPLALLTLIEAAFEDPANEQDLLSLSQHVEIKEGYFSYTLVINKRSYHAGYQENGKTRLMNLAERLKELYPDRHRLSILPRGNSREIRLVIYDRRGSVANEATRHSNIQHESI